jgi:hypothetical protein
MRLRDPYYKGLVRYRGIEYSGSHDLLSALRSGSVYSASSPSRSESCSTFSTGRPARALAANDGR